MAGKPTNTALQEEVAAAVAASPDGTPRGMIVKQFLGRGVSRASLYVWIERAMTGLAMNKAKGTHAPPIETDRRTMAALSVKPSGPIQFQEILNDLIVDCQMLRAMAKDDETGRIRNPRLLLEAVDKAGRTLDRAARIGAIVQDVQAYTDFLRSLADVIHQEDPAVRDRIVGKMRALGHGGMM